MAAATQSVTTSRTSVNNAWRYMQHELVDGIQFEVEEWDLFDQFDEFGMKWSGRAMELPLDISEGGVVASIAEGGYEARPQSPNITNATVDVIQLNTRFNASKLAQYADAGDTNQIKKQIAFQGAHAVRALARQFGDYLHGGSSAILCQATATQTGTTLTHTLQSGYNVSGITGAAFIADKFRNNDWVAAVSSAGALRNIGQITADPSTSAPSIVVVWNSATTVTSGDYIVKAASMGNTVVGDTDYNRGLVGLIDMTTAASIHGLSTTSVAAWSVAYSDTNAGRFSGSKLIRAAQEVQNKGGGKPNLVVMDQGVYRDAFNLERAGYVVNDPFSMDITGSIKAKGHQIFMSRRVPPGYVYVLDKSAINKWTMLPKPDGKFSWGEGKELIDQNLTVFRIDMPCALICKNRRKLTYFTSQTTA